MVKKKKKETHPVHTQNLIRSMRIHALPLITAQRKARRNVTHQEQAGPARLAPRAATRRGLEELQAAVIPEGLHCKSYAQPSVQSA